MTELDQETLFSLAAALAHRQVADYARRSGLDYLGDAALAPYEQQVVTTLAPGLVAFAARLSAALPPGFELASVLTQFFQDAETVAALRLYGEDATAGLAALGAALTKAGLPDGVLDPNMLSEALAAWDAASTVVARLMAQTNANQTLANSPLYQQVQPVQDEELLAKMAELVQDLNFKGLSRIDGGDILAADGYTILFSWRRGQSAARDELPQTSGLEETSGGAVVQETSSGGLDSPSGGGAEPQPEPASNVVALRLDTAAPPQVTVGLPFDLAAAIRQLASPTLAIADLSLTESASFAAVLPAGETFLAMRIQVAAPECEILGGDTRPVRILPGQDGPTVYFQLIPRRAGPLSIIVTVYQEADWIGSTRLRTEVAGGAPAGQSLTAPRGAVALTVNSQPLAPADVSQNTLREALDNGYSLAELQDLCFELEIDYEDLPGEGQSAKARELVTYCKRRGLLPALVERVIRDRPHLLVPA